MRPIEQEPSNECLLRIQNEISEVEKRELELRNEHANTVTPIIRQLQLQLQNDEMNVVEEPAADNSPCNSNDVRSISPQNICSKDHFKKNKIIAPQPKPAQLLAMPTLTRALSQPQLFNISPVKISSPHKGIMQKFIASRGKLNVSQAANQPVQANNFKKNLIMAPIEFNSDNIKAFQNIEKAHIERDTKGRPIRKGYVPVEEKIQSELRDLKNRETELKRLHKYNNNSIVRDSINDDDINNLSDDNTDNGDEWSPINGKLSKSIDALNNNSSLTMAMTFESSTRPIPQPRSCIRPAVSLATLIDLEPEMEPPSSHKLIERWEHIIQVNQQKERSYNIN